MVQTGGLDCIFASSTSTRSSISAKTPSRFWSPEVSFRPTAAVLSRLRAELSSVPDSTPIFRSSKASRAYRPRATDRRRRSVGSSTPCSAISASIPPIIRSEAEPAGAGPDSCSGIEKVPPAGPARAGRGWRPCRSRRSLDAHAVISRGADSPMMHRHKSWLTNR